ncbi:MAG: tRNA (adenosine(37)-N6)-threonylcarbamoyltransferase complex ATPase subunit type 1 TsaE [Acidimicrobiales bacterium]
MARELALRTDSAGETMALGAALARVVSRGDMLLLAGDLGAGKTTLTKGLARGLGVDDLVTSPTFTLVRSYGCANPAAEGDEMAVRNLVHADLFRLEGLTEVAELAIGELLEEEDACAVVEWGDVAGPFFGPQTLVVRLSLGDAPTERLVSVEIPDGWEPRRETLESVLCDWLGGPDSEEDRQE